MPEKPKLAQSETFEPVHKRIRELLSEEPISEETIGEVVRLRVNALINAKGTSKNIDKDELLANHEKALRKAIATSVHESVADAYLNPNDIQKPFTSEATTRSIKPRSN